MNEDAHSLVGKTIGGKYSIVKLLGEGGMGCVYLGEQMLGTSTRKVAVKTLHNHLSQDPQIRARFMRECGTVAELEHPNTIQVFDFGTTDEGLLYIVMEFVQGRSLADILEKDGPIAPERTIKILAQVCGSLEEAHGRGIVHRDLKPDNIVLCEKAGQKDWVEVLDFGIAKRSSETDPNEQKLTQQGMVLGTPPYMSPEQFTGQPIGPRSDIYSLAMMTYEMLTGKLPFEANTAWEWASQHMTAQPKPLEIHPNGALLPPAMRAAVMRGMEKLPDNRFANVGEYLDALKGVHVAMPPSGEAVATGRGKTEIGTPIQAPMMGQGAPPGYGGPPSPQVQQQHGGYTPPHGAQGQGPMAAVPAGPAHSSPKKSGAGLFIGLGIGALVLIGGGVGVAMTVGGKKDTSSVSSLTNGASSNPSDTPTATAAPSATETAEPGLAALSSAKTPTFVAPPSTGKGTAGTKTSASPTGAQTAPKPTGTPAVPGGAAAEICARAGRFKGKPAMAQAYEQAAAACRAAGGTPP